MNPDREVQDLAVSLTVASAQLLARLQAPPAANGSRNLHHYLDKLSGILEDLEEAVDRVETGASDLIDEEHDDAVFDDTDKHLCRSCASPIPDARLTAVPGTQFCVACAEKLQERHADPFEVVTESDVKRFQKKFQQDMEDERRRALPRRSAMGSIKSRWRARRKPKSTK